MSARRTVLILLLFSVSVAVGVAIQLATTPTRAVDRYPTMSVGAAEPAVTAELTQAIVGKEAQRLAATYSADMLTNFQNAMAPVVDVEDIRYIGGIERNGETLASYAATGRTQNGQPMISGFVIHVQDGKITGFN